MKKKILFSVFLIFCLSITAEPIGYSKALNEALNFIQKKKRRTITKRRITPAKRIKQSNLSNLNNNLYYVFNVGENEGFVIVSGDDRTESILGYTDHGKFDYDKMPDNMKTFLRGYEQQIKWASKNISAQQAIKVKSTRANTPMQTRHAIAPLIKTLWNQGTPYNNNIPRFKSLNKGKALTGCVATAMSQIMYFHKWPRNWSTTIPAYKSKGKEEKDIPEKSGENLFRWDDMHLTYNGHEDENSKGAKAVAKLMEYAGASLKMTYNFDGYGTSVTFSSKATVALKEYFNYSSTVHYVQSGNYTIDEWIDMIYNELANGRPMIYDGFAWNDSGHSFICDGYSNEDFFHINWGWGGMANGYFKLFVLNPNASGSGGAGINAGFSIAQDAIIGIQPKKNNETQFVDDSPMTVTVTNIKNQGATQYTREKTGDFIGLNFQVESWSFNPGAHCFDLSIGLFNGDRLVHRMSDEKTYPNGEYYNQELDINEGGTGIYKNLIIKSDVPDGIYQIKPISKLCSSKDWLPDAGAVSYHYIAVIKNNTLTLKSITSNLEVMSIKVEGSMHQKYEHKVTAIIKNNGEDFNGPIFLYDKTSNTTLSGDGTAIRKGRQEDVEFFFTPNKSTYKLVLASNKKGEDIIKGKTLDVNFKENSSNKTPKLKFEVSNVRNSEGTTIYGKSLTFNLTLTNMTDDIFKYPVVVTLHHNNESFISHVQLQPIIGSKQSNSQRITLNVPDYQTYRLVFFYGTQTGEINENYLVSEEEKEYTFMKGIEIFTSNGESKMVKATNPFTVPEEAVAVQLSTPISVTPNNNPNTLYFIDENIPIPNSLNKKNIVKNNIASNITLEDGYNFMNPKEFTAKKITYNRTFTSGLNEQYEGWQTIVLPFEVKQIKEGDNFIDWFHSKNDKNKNFWLHEFAEEGRDNYTGEGILYFNHAQNLKANNPYIIAVPGTAWGERYNLVGKKITFYATNAKVHKSSIPTINGNSYKFLGTFSKLNEKELYKLTNKGEYFVKSISPSKVDPFRGYFKDWRNNIPKSSRRLAIKIINDDETTAINNYGTIEKNEENNVLIYSLNGMCIVGKKKSDLKNLPSGIYIINGKKIYKK